MSTITIRLAPFVPSPWGPALDLVGANAALEGLIRERLFPLVDGHTLAFEPAPKLDVRLPPDLVKDRDLKAALVQAIADALDEFDPTEFFLEPGA